MKPASLFLVLSLIAVAGCVDEGRYPVSGEECSAEDPVSNVDASMADCVPVGI
jgi:hypothetical protein